MSILYVIYENNRFKSYKFVKDVIILIESFFWWDRYDDDDYDSFGYDFYSDYYDVYEGGYRKGNYLPLETIDDLVAQFNYTGRVSRRTFK